MSDRDRRSRREGQDWASQVPWHYGQRGPYEDYGWEPGESVLPEFRDPSVHEMPYERERYARQRGQSRQGGGMDAQRRMQNPYESDYERGQYGRGYDENRWRSGGQGSYGGMYNRDYDYGGGYDENRWRGGQGYSGSSGSDYNRRGMADQGSYGGTYGRDYGYERDYDENRWRSQGSYGRDSGYRGGYDENRWRTGAQGSYGGYGRDYGSDENRWRTGGQGSGSSYDYERRGMGDQGSYGGYGSPMTWTYTEYWLIPGPFSGRGPKGYQRSDERIREDICERLTQHGQLDASDIEIDVSNGQVTLRGTVDSRQAKRMAEDAAESVSGAGEVRNELRVKQDQGSTGQQSMSGQSTARQQSTSGQSSTSQQSTSGQSSTGQQSTSGQSGQQREIGGGQNRG